VRVTRLIALTVLSMVALSALAPAAFAISGPNWIVFERDGAMWLRTIADTLAWPIESAWLNRHVDSKSRATVISMVSQANAIGQVAGGPPLGALAGRSGLRAALLTSGLILTPIPALFLRLREVRRTDADKQVDPV